MSDYQAKVSDGCRWFSDGFPAIADLLQEYGYIQIQDDVISMASMMRDMIGDEIAQKPNIAFHARKQLEGLCLDNTPKFNPESFCAMVKRSAEPLPAESSQQQLLYLENIFYTFKEYVYIPGMEFILSQMSALLEIPTPTANADLALLWDYRVAYLHITSPQNSDIVKYAHEKDRTTLSLLPQNSAALEIAINVLNNSATTLSHSNDHEGAYPLSMSRLQADLRKKETL